MEDLVDVLNLKVTLFSVGGVKYENGSVEINSNRIKYESTEGRIVGVDLDEIGLIAINEEEGSVYCQTDESGVTGVEGMLLMVQDEDDDASNDVPHNIETVIKPVESEMVNKIFLKLSSAVKVLDAQKEVPSSGEDGSDSSSCSFADFDQREFED